MPTDGISAAGRGTETSVRRRFLGSSRTKHCLTAHCIGTLPVWRLSKIAHFAAIRLGVMSAAGTTVWTGRALQVRFADLEAIGLALLYPALEYP